jgi:hypothetical protein
MFFLVNVKEKFSKQVMKLIIGKSNRYHSFHKLCLSTVEKREKEKQKEEELYHKRERSERLSGLQRHRKRETDEDNRN